MEEEIDLPEGMRDQGKSVENSKLEKLGKKEKPGKWTKVGYSCQAGEEA